jgi:hypothetical protein
VTDKCQRYVPRVLHGLQPPHKGGSRCQAPLQHPGVWCCWPAVKVMARKACHTAERACILKSLSLPCMCLNPIPAVQETVSCCCCGDGTPATVALSHKNTQHNALRTSSTQPCLAPRGLSLTFKCLIDRQCCHPAAVAYVPHTHHLVAPTRQQVPPVWRKAQRGHCTHVALEYK